MKTAIIYYSKHGTTERVTHLIGEKLTNKVDYISLKECPRPDIRTYDRIILGTAMRALQTEKLLNSVKITNRY